MSALRGSFGHLRVNLIPLTTSIIYLKETRRRNAAECEVQRESRYFSDCVALQGLRGVLF
jgi:hypothetical protein